MSMYRSTTLAPKSDGSARPGHYHVSAATHEGKRRNINEDNFSVNAIVGLTEGSRRSLRGNGMREPLVCAVFDGTGGGEAGVAASRMCAEFAGGLYRELVERPTDRERLVASFVNGSNNEILSKLYSFNGHRGASTFVMTVISSGKMYAYWLGDSRLYILREGTLYRVSHDHTLAMKKYRSGEYTIDEAETSPDRHKLTAFLGIKPASGGELRPDQYEPTELIAGDKLLMCSDGLYSLVNDGEIGDVLRSSAPDKACVLVNKAVANGGSDNITCLVIECTE